MNGMAQIGQGTGTTVGTSIPAEGISNLSGAPTMGGAPNASGPGMSGPGNIGDLGGTPGGGSPSGLPDMAGLGGPGQFPGGMNGTNSNQSNSFWNQLGQNLKNNSTNQRLGSYWGRNELLMMWIKSGPIPPLALQMTPSGGSPNPLGGPPVLGDDNLSTNLQSGGLFSYGFSFDQSNSVGAEIVYFFLGSRTESEGIGSAWLQSPNLIERPYIDPTTGQAVNQIISEPGVARGGIRESISARATGWEVNLVSNWMASSIFNLDALVGWRYFQLNEGLQVVQNGFQINSMGGLGNYQVISDQIDAHNQFNGGQLGLRADLHLSQFFLEWSGKIAIGANFQSVRRNGLTVTIPAGTSTAIPQTGGFLVLGSNAGEVTKQVLAFLPESTLRLGIRLSSSTRLYVGYQITYLSNAVRPGDQVDLHINNAQLSTIRYGQPLVGPLNPYYTIHNSDVWMQGVVIGVETRF